MIILSAPLLLSGCGSPVNYQSNTTNTASMPINEPTPATQNPQTVTPATNPTSTTKTTNVPISTPLPVTPIPRPVTSVTPVVNEAKAISIKNFSFDPAVLNINKGATVIWTNNDPVPHQIKSATFNSDILSNSQTFSFTFNDVGSFDYSCAIHPSMTGQIIVK